MILREERLKEEKTSRSKENRRRKIVEGSNSEDRVKVG